MPPPPEDASAQTLQQQYDEAQARAAAIEAKLDKALKREDTGVHRVNTEALHITLRGDLVKTVRKWALIVAALIGVPTGGLAARVYSQAPVDAQQTEETLKRIAGEQAGSLEVQVEENQDLAQKANRNVKTLGREVIRRDDERAEQLDFISDKLDEISPKAKRVKPPAAVKKRRAKKQEEALDKRVDDLFGEDPEEDPLR